MDTKKKRDRNLKFKISEAWYSLEHLDVKGKADFFNKKYNTNFNHTTMARWASFINQAWKYKFDNDENYGEAKLKQISRAMHNLRKMRKVLQYERQGINKETNDSTKKTLFRNVVLKQLNKFNDFKLGKYKSKIVSKDKVMLVLNSDLQIGMDVNIISNVYNYNVLLKRQSEFLHKVKEYAKLYNINNFIYLDMGDAIDHNSMRKGHYRDLESTLHSVRDQLVKWSKLRLETLKELNKLGNVEYGLVDSNHCRINGSKEWNLYRDDFGFLIDDIFELTLGYPKVKMETIDYNGGLYKLKLFNNDIFLCHGDKLKSKPNVHNKNWINQIKNSYNIKNIDLLITGHFHHTFIGDENFGVGSMVGTNSFSAQMGLNSKPAQGLVIVDKNEIKCIPIYLGK